MYAQEVNSLVKLDKNLCTNYQKTEAISDRSEVWERCDHLSPYKINRRIRLHANRARFRRLASRSCLQTQLEENHRLEDGEGNKLLRF